MYTKGKWGLSVNGLNISSHLDNTYIPLAKMQYEDWMEFDKNYPMDLETAKANACLIAAAPDLLEACEDMKACIRMTLSDAAFGSKEKRLYYLNKIHAAITKAKNKEI